MHETLRRPTGLLVAQAVAQTIANQRKNKISVWVLFGSAVSMKQGADH